MSISPPLFSRLLKLVAACSALCGTALAEPPVPQWIERVDPADYALLAADLPSPMTTSDLEVHRRAVAAGVSDADGHVSSEETFWLQVEQVIRGSIEDRMAVEAVVAVLETPEGAAAWAERWHLQGARATANDLGDPRLTGVGASFVGSDRVSIRYRNVAARFRWTMSGSGVDRVERVARLWLDKVTRVMEDDEDQLTIEVDLKEGQVFTQGDRLPVKVWVKRGHRDPVSGASVELSVVSPTGRVVGQSPVMSTDKTGQGRITPHLPWWPAHFTACAAVGSWRLVADARIGREQASLIRNFEVVELVVSTAQVAHNLLRIMNWWQSSVTDPLHPKNGVDEPFVDALWYPKGPKVNMRSRIDPRFAPYTSSALASDTLRFLDRLRFSSSHSDRVLMAGVDYGPVGDGRGLGHMSVAIFPRGQPWDTGYVLESWWNQKKEVVNAADWVAVFSLPGAFGPGSRWLKGPWHGEYPTTGSDGGYYPSKGVHRELAPGRVHVLTYSPVEVLVVDDRGQRSGRLPDGTLLDEIPDAEHLRNTRRDGTLVSMLSVPGGRYQVRIAGTGDGTFHLVTGTDREIVNYGEQRIRAGELATLALESHDLRQPLVMPDGRRVDTAPGFPEERSPTPPGGSPPDESLPAAGITEPARTTAFAVQAGRRALAPAGTVDVPVWLVNAEALANMNLNVHYDPAVVRPVRNSHRGNLVSQALFEANVRDRGVIRLGFAQRENLRGTGTLAQLAFEAIGRPGARTPLRLEVTMASAAAGDLVTPSQIFHGEIVIVGSDGRLPGDTTGRGVLTALDAMNALKISVGNLPVDLVADVDQDGQVTARDATLILQRVVGRSSGGS